ncbi:MAG: arginine--tRNA ligase [Candidatus Peribacteraceae bacterium]|nr:arginine--tRNA ligase [Candidatus Peribacteraceae bacterium]
MLERLTTQVHSLLKERYKLTNVAVEWRNPPQQEQADFATPVALQAAKAAGVPPKEIAQALLSVLQGLPDVERAEVAGVGYVNVTLQPSALLKLLLGTQEALTARPINEKDPPVIVDYCGPNIAKPLGAHHLGSHIIGQVIINIYKHRGVRTIGWTYPGDWGTQFGKLAVANRLWGKKKSGASTVEELLALYVRFHKEAEKKPALEDEAREAFAKLEAGDKELRAFWKHVVDTSYAALDALYARLHVHPDVVTGESFYEDKMAPVLEEGVRKGVFTEGEKGALIVQFAEDTGLPPLLVRKSDGSTLYATRDLAMIRYRIDTYHPSALYYVVDVAQSLHFKQLLATCRLLGWDMPEFEHTVFGRMRFADASMSTRKGTSIRMEQLFDEAVRRAAAIIAERKDTILTDDPAGLAEMMGTGAIAYGILSQNRKMDIIFDWDRMLSFEGNSAPYLQYTHARARSVLRKAGGAPGALPTSSAGMTPHERALVHALLAFPGVLEEACVHRMPHTLTNHLYTLCQVFNAFYNAEPILKAEESIRSLRLSLTALTARVLQTGAGLLTLRVPERM